MSEKLPRLTAHFEQHQIDIGLTAFNWFLVVFVDSLVSDILFRVWDAFLYEGTKVGKSFPSISKMSPLTLIMSIFRADMIQKYYLMQGFLKCML